MIAHCDLKVLCFPSLFNNYFMFNTCLVFQINVWFILFRACRKFFESLILMTIIILPNHNSFDLLLYQVAKMFLMWSRANGQKFFHIFKQIALREISHIREKRDSLIKFWIYFNGFQVLTLISCYDNKIKVNFNFKNKPLLRLCFCKMTIMIYCSQNWKRENNYHKYRIWIYWQCEKWISSKNSCNL